MNSLVHGIDTSVKNSVTEISKFGFWVLAQDKEYFVPFADYPAFKHQPVDTIFNLQFISPTQLYWPEIDVDIEYENDYVPSPDELPDFEDGLNADDDSDEIDDSVTPPEVEHLVATVQAPPISAENERKAAKTAKKIKDTDFFEQLQAVWGKPASDRVTEAVTAWEKELQEMHYGGDSEAEDKLPNSRSKKGEVPEEFDMNKYL